jgi:bifunctional ADP-heptose synthase (sugar kinase/adenylyltransferase)
MDQIARWYGISVVIDQKMEDARFSGKIQLDLNLSEVLKILGKNDLTFRMEDNILFVRSI